MQQPVSYRDTAGFVIVKDHSVHRFVTHSYSRQYDKLMNSGLYHELVAKELLIPHTEDILSLAQQNSWYRVLLPEIIPCISLPYEWSPGQWKDVVLCFLQINLLAMEHGMILKDATPFNFSFHRSKCVFIDTLSFELYEDGKPWIAYRQFCESMLGTLALINYRDARWIELMTAAINGLELPFISAHLPMRTYFNPSILLHIHWHAKYHSKGKEGLVQKSSFNKQTLPVLWGMLYRNISKWKTRKLKNGWSSYYDNGISSQEYIEDKTAVITGWLAEACPKRVVDLGANNGRFSLLASLHADEVIAVEGDHSCADVLYGICREKQVRNITTIVADITQPTPGTGWNNEEHEPLLKRLHCDMVLALALVHHLCISKNIPLAFVASLLASLTSKYAVVEFVPKSDEKVQAMLANREDIFSSYSERRFLDAFHEYFELLETHSCASGRKLFLWIKK